MSWEIVAAALVILPSAALLLFWCLQAKVKLRVRYNEDLADIRVRQIAKSLAAMDAFSVPFWARNGHISTMYCSVLRKSDDSVCYEREEVRFEDGGAVSIDIVRDSRLDAPVAFFVPGIAGSSNAHYVRNAVATMHRQGFHCVVFNHRGCGQKLHTPRLFTLGGVDDLHAAVVFAAEMFPQSKFVLVGFSMGANIVVNYCANATLLHVRVAGGVSISQGYDAYACGNALSYFYSRVLLKKMLALVAEHREVFATHKYDVESILRAATPHEFDELLTLRVHKQRGWRDANHYYEASSSLRVIADVAVPVLCLNALDDPIVLVRLVTHVEEIAAQKTGKLLVASLPYGGHLAFAKGFLIPDRESIADAVMAKFCCEILRK